MTSMACSSKLRSDDRSNILQGERSCAQAAQRMWSGCTQKQHPRKQLMLWH